MALSSYWQWYFLRGHQWPRANSRWGLGRILNDPTANRQTLHISWAKLALIEPIVEYSRFWEKNWRFGLKVSLTFRQEITSILALKQKCVQFYRWASHICMVFRKKCFAIWYPAMSSKWSTEATAVVVVHLHRTNTFRWFIDRKFIFYLIIFFLIFLFSPIIISTLKQFFKKNYLFSR